MIASILLFLFSTLNPVRPGYAIVQFQNSFRDHLTQKTIYPKNLPVFKTTFEKFGVIKLERLINDPNMPEDAKELGLDLIYLIQFDPQKDVFAFAKEMRKYSEVKYADPDYAKKYFFYPNDPYLTHQWSLARADAIHGWDVTKGDSTIIIGIDDTGVDWRHEDLVGNIYQNLGEDADGDGHVIEYINGHWTFDPGDINGRDDDGDGKVDDFVGWDFYENNNDPSPAHNGPDFEHGTHVAGIASAATNNGIGVAGVGYSCKILPLRSHWLSNSVSAVYYAVTIGADVFNMSWGGWTGSLGTAFEYAYNHGMVLVAAAGNDNTSNPMYPAAHPLVIAVAATDPYDHKSSYSNYGSWVDIAAPGDNILSTIPGNGYDSFYGTSMASPFVSGVVGLLRSINHYYSPDSIKAILLATADSMPDDPYYNAGNLGAGRVNVYKAVSTLGRRYLSFVTISSLTLIDDGDGDGRPDPGENVEMRLSLVDSAGWQPAENLRIIARSLVPQITLTDSFSFIGDVQPGDSANNESDPIAFSVSDTTSPIMGKIELTLVTSSPGPVIKKDTVSFLVSQPYILLVDDDGGENYETYYTDVFNSLGFTYDYWDVASQGTPQLSGIYGLNEHQLVIWFTGQESTPFSQEEVDSIESAMDHGVNFIISSQNAAQSLAGSAFLSNYLRASLVDTSVSDYFVDGVAGDPISQGLRFVVFGTGGANDANSKDAVSPVGGASTFLVYHSAGSGAAIRYSGSYKLAFLAFPWEAINSSVTGYDSGAVLLRNIMRWMGLPVGVEEREVHESPAFTLENSVITNGYFVIRSNRPQKVTIYDVSGRVVKTLRIQGHGIFKVSVSDLRAGVYYARGAGKTLKFLVLRRK